MQMAARETGFGAVEQYMHKGKLLALELLVRVFEDPHHVWTNVRTEVLPRPIHPAFCNALNILSFATLLLFRLLPRFLRRFCHRSFRHDLKDQMTHCKFSTSVDPNCNAGKTAMLAKLLILSNSQSPHRQCSRPFLWWWMWYGFWVWV